MIKIINLNNVTILTIVLLLPLLYLAYVFRKFNWLSLPMINSIVHFERNKNEETEKKHCLLAAKVEMMVVKKEHLLFEQPHSCI